MFFPPILRSKVHILRRFLKILRRRAFAYLQQYESSCGALCGLEGHPNFITGSKVMTILLNGWILPNSGVASGRVCACNLQSRLVNFILDNRKKVKNNTLLLRRLAHIIVTSVLLLVFLVNKI